MKMSGSQVIQAPRLAVWKGLNNPKVLQQCIPGCAQFAQNTCGSKIEPSSLRLCQ